MIDNFSAAFGRCFPWHSTELDVRVKISVFNDSEDSDDFGSHEPSS